MSISTLTVSPAAKSPQVVTVRVYGIMFTVNSLASTSFTVSDVPSSEMEPLEAMKRASQAYGQPHLHAGIGLRRLGKHMECRDALDYRLIFASDGDTLVFVFYGTHKAVQAFVKNRR